MKDKEIVAKLVKSVQELVIKCPYDGSDAQLRHTTSGVTSEWWEGVCAEGKHELQLSVKTVWKP